ncbi:hypothetical protein H5J24_03730 [Chryseobacterium capnotolerans]|uniref:hypothetical protein n=1 Tax=Chryseobacterium capnotolerans TaxID=2759528 RepID=UPI001E2E2147|nr:hypothetical protein [Chryseobacterium capnotolerans]UHO39244.1 hypothetical protein H5J24_03730 [Chryseobacterium capnotolerans]
MKLPVKQTDLKTLGLKAYGTGVGTEAIQYAIYKADVVNNGKLPINFGGINIEDAPDSEYFTPGMLSFYGKNQGNNCEGFKLNLENPANFQKILDYLLNKKKSSNWFLIMAKIVWIERGSLMVNRTVSHIWFCQC